MRRPLLSLPVLAAVLAAVALTVPGDGARPGGGADGTAPASYSAGVSGRAPTQAATANWGNRSAAASADPARWEEPDGADAARRERVRMRRRLARLVLVSGAERLGVRPAELRRAVHTVLRAQRRAGRPARGQLLRPRERRAGRPAGAELGRLRDELAAALGRELGLGRAEVLRAARAELGARLLHGTGMGIVSDAGRRLALDCFDAPATCDVAALRRELRFARLLGR